MKSIITHLLAVLVLSAFVAPAEGKSTTINISTGDVLARSGDRGQYYVLNLALPDDLVGNRLEGAVIEFELDVMALSEEDSMITPVVGVFPLEEPFVDRGAYSIPVFDEFVPTARPVILGERHVLRIDITRIVQAWLSEASSNHGLVIGTLTGPNVGVASLKNESGTAARITFFYQSHSKRPISE